MSHREPLRPPARRTGTGAAIVAVLVLATAGVLGDLATRSWTALSAAATSSVASGLLSNAPHESLQSSGALGLADGLVPGDAARVDDDIPAVTRLEPELLAALRRAAGDAAIDGVTVYVNSGWRSRAYQDQLFAEAVTKYGSAAKAARWVAPPGTSAHEKGEAVDIGHSDATSWLSWHGARYGLCQIYRNESWHFELRPDAVDHGCPAMYADPTHDPRGHR
jgi:D-alanyl-D-alanine carboxypeptidase